jgi:hypothetical protein
VTKPLGVVAAAWAERQNEVWREACDRVAMGFICRNPDADTRTLEIVQYRQLCREEEKRIARRPF